MVNTLIMYISYGMPLFPHNTYIFKPMGTVFLWCAAWCSWPVYLWKESFARQYINFPLIHAVSTVDEQLRILAALHSICSHNRQAAADYQWTDRCETITTHVFVKKTAVQENCSKKVTCEEIIAHYHYVNSKNDLDFLIGDRFEGWSFGVGLTCRWICNWSRYSSSSLWTYGSVYIRLCFWVHINTIWRHFSHQNQKITVLEFEVR